MKFPILLSALLLAVVTTVAGDKSTDTKDIQGTWVPTKAELGGKPMKDEQLKKIEWLKLENGKYEVKAESLDKGTYEIHSDAKPKTIDITGSERRFPASTNSRATHSSFATALTAARGPRISRAQPTQEIFSSPTQRRRLSHLQR